MNKLPALLLASTIALAAVFAPVTAIAGLRSGGSGGSETGTPLFFDQIASFNGSTPAWSGTYTLTNSIPGYYTWTTVQLSFKGKPVDVPNGTSFYVTVYTSDPVTHIPFPPVAAPAMGVLSKVGTEKVTLVIPNPPGGSSNRQLDGAVVSAGDGSTVVIAHP